MGFLSYISEEECKYELPNNIRDLLDDLKGENVIVLLKSGEKERVQIEKISGDFLIAKFECCFKFILLDFICGVLVDGEDIKARGIFHNMC